MSIFYRIAFNGGMKKYRETLRQRVAQKAIRYLMIHFQDRRGVASLENTVLM